MDVDRARLVGLNDIGGHARGQADLYEDDHKCRVYHIGLFFGIEMIFSPVGFEQTEDCICQYVLIDDEELLVVCTVR